MFLMFVCWQLCVKTTDRMFVKILPNVYLWSRINWFNFGSRLLLDPELDIFLKYSSTLQDMSFSHSLTHPWKNWLDLSEDVIVDVSVEKNVCVKFWKSLRSTLMEVCTCALFDWQNACNLLQILTWHWVSCVRHRTHWGTSTVASTSRAHKSRTSVSPSKSPLSVSAVSSIGGRSCLKPASLEYFFIFLSLESPLKRKSVFWTSLSDSVSLFFLLHMLCIL